MKHIKTLPWTVFILFHYSRTLKGFIAMSNLQIPISGGWSDLSSPTSHEKTVFDTAFGKLSGLSYRPLLVSKQIVNGTNYAFFCEAAATAIIPQIGFVIAEAYESLEGNINRTNITIYGMVPQTLNVWGEARLLTDEDSAIFSKVNFKGVNHKPLIVSSEENNGNGYRFFCISNYEDMPSKIGFTIITLKTGDETVKVVNVATFGG